MAKELADLFANPASQGLETAYGTVTTATPLRVRLDSMEADDVGPLAFVRNRPRIDDRVMLLRSRGQKNWLVLGPGASMGDLILAWDEPFFPGVVRRVWYSIRRSGVWEPAVMYGGAVVRSTPIISATADAGPVSSGAIPSIQETFMGGDKSNNMLPRYFVMSDGAALVFINSTVGGVGRFRVHKKDPSTGAWTAPIVSPFQPSRATYCVQSGDTVWVLTTTDFTSYVELWRVDYASGVPNQTLVVLDGGGPSGDRRRGLYYDAANGLIHVSWIVGASTVRLSAYNSTTLTHVYTEDVPLPVASNDAPRIGGDGGASFLLVTSDSVAPFAAPRVLAITASGSGYSYVDETASVPQAFAWGATTVFYDGIAVNLIDNSGQVIVRFGPNNYSELIQVESGHLDISGVPIFYANVARAGPGAKTRIIYNTAAATFPGVYQDDVIVLP